MNNKNEDISIRALAIQGICVELERGGGGGVSHHK
jgi:hypothetical protein